MLKRIVSLISAVIFVFFAASFGAFAQTGSRISVEKSAAKPGDTVTIYLRVFNNPGMVSLRMRLKYDSSRLSLTEITDGDIISDGFFTVVDESKNPVEFSWNDYETAKDYTGNGKLVFLTFKVLDTAPAGRANINISYAPAQSLNWSMKEIALTVDDGYITVCSDPKAELEREEALAACEHIAAGGFTVTNKASCEFTGTSVKKCTVCGNELDVEMLEPTGHSFGKWAVSGDTKTRACSVCGKEESVAVKATGTDDGIGESGGFFKENPDMALLLGIGGVCIVGFAVAALVVSARHRKKIKEWEQK